MRFPPLFPVLLGLWLAACSGPQAEQPSTTLEPPPTAAPVATAVPTHTLVPTPREAVQIQREATPAASWEQSQVKNAVDGNPNLTWNSTRPPPEWFGLAFTRPYAVTRIELDVSQNPPGDTVHELWLGTGAELTRLARLGPARTTDGQTLSVQLDQPRIATRMVVRTLSGPSHVAWRDVRVFGAPAELPPPPVRVSLQPWLKGDVQMPTGIVSPRDGTGRMFLLEQPGRIRVTNRNGEFLGRYFLEIPNRVSCCTERGLLGLAFPPGYAEKRYFYLAYTSSGGPNVPFGALVVSRWYVTGDPNVADPNREEILLVVPKPHEAHNGGHIEFGPRDGYLYVGLGDGGPGGGGDNRSQDLGNHLGKILRIDPENNRPQYGLPPTNPFANREGARSEIWSSGLRNPWGFAFDWSTGDLFIGDTGETEWEEVNVQRVDSQGGENYGWPRLEGRQCFRALSCDSSGFVMPATEYHHIDGCALVGGAVPRAGGYRQLQGAYVYADFCSGRIWALRDTGGWSAIFLIAAEFPISTIGRDEGGTVYVADYGRGRVFRLEEN